MCGILYLHDPHQLLSGREMADMTFLGLSAMQYRGQHGGGLAYSDGDRVRVGKWFGLVATQYDSVGADDREDPRPYTDQLGKMEKRKPFRVMGHLRYATAGPAGDLIHFQPHFIEPLGGRVAYLANGDIPLLTGEKERLKRLGVRFESENDGELTLRKICFLKESHAFMLETKGAYSGILMTRDTTYFIRDEFGFRPFLVGKIDGEIIVAASESSVLNILGATFDFEVERGSVVEIANDGTMTRHPYPGSLPECSAHCVFCLDYFGGPHSRLFVDSRPWNEVPHKSSYAHEFGRQLAREHPVEADCISSIPQSGNSAAKGFSAQSGIPNVEILVRNWSVPRTFILSLADRLMAIRLKYGVLLDAVRSYPRIVLVDDSIVRANTTRGTVKLVRDAGAKEVHVRVSFPPIIHPCFMGIAMPTREELAAASRSVSELREFIGADSLEFLSPEGVATAMKSRGDDIKHFCTACYSGNYPVPV